MSVRNAVRCRMCNKSLPKIWYATSWATERFGEPLETKEDETYEVGHKYRVAGFYGHHGKDGRGNFCSYKCGWKFANWALANGKVRI